MSNRESGVEYADVQEGTDGIRGDEATLSLASWLGISVARAIELRKQPGELTRQIELRSARRSADPSVALRYLERRLVSG